MTISDGCMVGVQRHPGRPPVGRPARGGHSTLCARPPKEGRALWGVSRPWAADNLGPRRGHGSSSGRLPRSADPTAATPRGSCGRKRVVLAGLRRGTPRSAAKSRGGATEPRHAPPAGPARLAPFHRPGPLRGNALSAEFRRRWQTLHRTCRTKKRSTNKRMAIKSHSDGGRAMVCLQSPSAPAAYDARVVDRRRSQEWSR